MYLSQYILKIPLQRIAIFLNTLTFSTISLSLSLFARLYLTLHLTQYLMHINSLFNDIMNIKLTRFEILWIWLY